MGVISTLYSVLVRLENKTDVDKLDWVPERAMEVVRVYEERHMRRDWGSWVCSVRKEGSGKNLIAAFSYLMGRYKEDRARVCLKTEEEEAMVTSWDVRNSDWILGKTFSLCGWPNRGTDCTERLLNLQLCRHSKLIWTRLLTTSSNWTYFEWGFGLDDLQRSFPT